MAQIMNQSLTPTRLDPKVPFTPSNYPDKKSVVAAYKRMVQMVLETQEERNMLQKALRTFLANNIVEDLTDALKALLDPPERRILYVNIRPLIPNRLRQEYNTHIPHIPSFEKKVIHMKQQGARSLGFSIRGGKEYGCSVYVSNVVPSSKAAQCGLKAGDELIRVNGLTLLEATNEEVANLIRLKKTLTLTVRAVGMIPETRPGSKVVGWKVVAEEKPKNHHESLLKSTRRVQVEVDQETGMGASIYCDGKNGVSIVSVTPNSALQHAGLQAGDVIVEVNGHGLLNVPQSEAVRLLKSSNVLFLTVRVDEKSESSAGEKRGEGVRNSGNGHYNPFDNPPEDFELRLQDVDIDAELVPHPGQESTGFVLKSKNGEVSKLDVRQNKQSQWERYQSHLSVLGMEVEEQSKMLPGMASPAADGYGPTFTLPTLMRMFPPIEQPNLGEEEADTSLGLAVSPDRPLSESYAKQNTDMSPRNSMAMDMNNFGGEMPPTLASLFSNTGPGEAQNQARPPSIAPPPSPPPFATVSGSRRNSQEQMTSTPSQPPGSRRASGITQPLSNITNPTSIPATITKDEGESTSNEKRNSIVGQKVTSSTPAPLGVSKSISSDLSSYQFPVDEEEEPATPPPPLPSFDKAPGNSAMKKISSSDVKTRTKKPSFSDSVEIIGTNESTTLSVASDAPVEGVHPSNMEFSPEVLKGRQVAFHTVPKTAPLKIAIRGGTDTPLGGQIIISQILEGGAAAQYGRLNIGDQILVCDGVSLLEVTHNEAAQTLKKAIDMESTSIDFVVAVNKPELDSEGDKTAGNGAPPPPMNSSVQTNSTNKTENGVQKSSLRPTKLQSPPSTRRSSGHALAFK